MISSDDLIIYCIPALISVVGRIYTIKINNFPEVDSSNKYERMIFHLISIIGAFITGIYYPTITLYTIAYLIPYDEFNQEAICLLYFNNIMYDIDYAIAYSLISATIVTIFFQNDALYKLNKFIPFMINFLIMYKFISEIYYIFHKKFVNDQIYRKIGCINARICVEIFMFIIAAYGKYYGGNLMHSLLILLLPYLSLIVLNKFIIHII